MWRGLVLLLIWFRWFKCTVQLLFHSVFTFSSCANKTVGCKMSTKSLNNYKQNTFCDIFEQMHTQEYRATTKQTLRLQLNEKKSKESKTRLMSWYWKRKPTWTKGLISHNSHPLIMFSFNWLVIIWRGVGGSFEIGRARSRGWKNFGQRWTGG